MNSDTGKAYEGLAAVTAAAERGEKLVAVSPRTVRFIKEARDNRAAALRKKRRSRDKMQRASRRANRG